MSKLPAFLLSGLVLSASGSWAAGTKINGVTYDEARARGPAPAPVAGAREALPPEQALRFKKMFLFPSLDDVSGAVAPKLDDKLIDIFTRNPRFELVRDPQVVKALSPDENAYAKAAENEAVHREAARVTSADTTVLLHTRNVGAKTEMTLQFRDASGALLFAETGSVPGSAPMETRWALIEKLYKAVLARLPFDGTVTGRSSSTLTLDLGFSQVRAGDVLEVARLVSVQRHPLLGTVVGTDYVRTGRAKVTNVDRVMSFAETIEEFPGERVAPGQKILQARNTLVHRPVAEPPAKDEEVEPAARPKKPKRGEEEPQLSEDERLKGDFDRPKARFGHVGANLAYGSISHSQTSGGSIGEYSGSGIGGDLDGELWVTKNWIFALGLGLHSASLSGNGAALGSTSWQNFEADVGYRFFPDELAEGVTLTGSVGYQAMKFDIPASGSVGGKRYAGPVFRVAGDIAFLRGQSILAGFAIQPFASLTDLGGSLGTPNRGTVIGIQLAWKTELSPAFSLKVGLRYDSANGSYDTTSTATVSDKRFAIGPGIYYSF